MILGREPALWGALARAVVLLVSTFIFTLSTDQQGWLNATSAAVIGLVVALTAYRERLVPALLGLLEATLAGTVAWGWNLPPDKQAVIMGVALAVVAVWTRDRVVAPVDENGQRRTA